MNETTIVGLLSVTSEREAIDLCGHKYVSRQCPYTVQVNERDKVSFINLHICNVTGVCPCSLANFFFFSSLFLVIEAQASKPNYRCLEIYDIETLPENYQII